MKCTFPLIKDVDGVLAGKCEGTHGGTKTVGPPRYSLAVTNPPDTEEAPLTGIVAVK